MEIASAAVATPAPAEIQPTSRTLPNGLIESVLGNTKVLIRASDEWIKVSSIADGSRMWKNWYKQAPNKNWVENKRIELGHSVVQHVEGGPNALRGYYAHKDVAVEFAGWVSPQFRSHLNRLGFGVLVGDMGVMAQTIVNHDSINNTTSTVHIQTTDNNLDTGADEERTIVETEQDKRIRTIARTKHTCQVMRTRNVSQGAYAQKNNLVNKAVFRFRCNTRQFKVEKGIHKKQSPRDFAQPQQLDGISFTETIFAGLVANAPENADERSLIGKMRIACEAIGAVVEEAGVHRLPLRTTPIVIEGRKAPETKRIEPAPQPQAIEGTATEGTPVREGRGSFAPRQVDLNRFFERRTALQASSPTV